MPAKMAMTPASPLGSWPGPVHVGVTQDGVLQPVGPVEKFQVQLADVLGKGVGRQGIDRRVLVAGDRIGVAVDGAAGGRKHDLVHAFGGGDGKQPDGAQHVGVGVGHRIQGGLSHAALGGQVENNLGPFALDNLVDSWIIDGRVIEGRPMVEVAQLAGTEIVNHGYGVTVIQQAVHQMGPDEAGPAGDQDFGGFCHRLGLFSGRCRHAHCLYRN